MEYDKALKLSGVHQHMKARIFDTVRAALLSAFGIVFFVCWAVVGYIHEKCHKAFFK